MTGIAIKEFSGMAPKIASRKINPGQAQYCLNAELWSKDFRAVRQPLIVNVPSKDGTKKSIYPLNGQWLSWLNEVDVVEAPIASDMTGRIYYTGDNIPKTTNNALATVGVGTGYPLDEYQLGVPAPETAPTLNATGGVGSATTRSYVYTFVTQWGEESAPSPITELTGKDDDTWNVTAMDVAPLNTGGIIGAVHSAGVVTVTCSAKHLLRTDEMTDIAGAVGMTDLNDRFVVTRIDEITFSVALTTAQTYTSGGTWSREANLNVTDMTKRIYRTLVNTFKYVDEIPAATTSYADTTADTDLGEDIPSVDWEMPPVGLTGLITLPNGVMAGFVNNELCLSEPNIPYAWPITYRKNTDWTIVAIKDWGQSIVIGTTGKPYRVTGTHPDVMTMSRINIRQACASSRGMVTLENGVAYPSPDGLVYIGSNTVAVITEHLLRKDEWDQFNPSSLISFQWDDRYYGFYTNGGASGTETGCVIFDPEEENANLTLSESQATGGYVNLIDDAFYFIEDGHIKQWSAGGADFTANFKSKKFITPRPVALKAARFHLEQLSNITQTDFDAALAAGFDAIAQDISNGTLFDTGAFAGATVGMYTVAGGPYLDVVNALGKPAFVTFSLYIDGVLAFTRNVDTEDAFRLPGNVLSDNYEFEFSASQVSISDFVCAETMSELADA